MDHRTNTYALVTGASKGLGKSIAIALAKRGFNLLLVARSEKELHELETQLTQDYQIAVAIKNIDLSQRDSAKQLSAWVEENNYKLNALVNNAGYGLWGKFDQLELGGQLEMCQLNMNTLLELCHLFIPNLGKQSQSYILNVASTAAYQSVPTLGVYSATKAFVLSFSRALTYELKDSTISVSCICPGPIDTGFAHRAGLDAFSKMAEKFNMQPDVVAEIAVKGMLDQKAEIIPGINNRISAFGTRLLPKFLIEKIAAGIYKT